MNSFKLHNKITFLKEIHRAAVCLGISFRIFKRRNNNREMNRNHFLTKLDQLFQNTTMDQAKLISIKTGTYFKHIHKSKQVFLNLAKAPTLHPAGGQKTIF